MTEDRVIEKYVEAHPNMTEADISKYADELNAEYKINKRLLRRLIRVETRRTKSMLKYDLDYDIQLVEALKIVKTEDFKELVASTKSLEDLQAEAEKNETEENK